MKPQTPPICYVSQRKSPRARACSDVLARWRRRHGDSVDVHERLIQKIGGERFVWRTIDPVEAREMLACSCAVVGPAFGPRDYGHGTRQQRHTLRGHGAKGILPVSIREKFFEQSTIVHLRRRDQKGQLPCLRYRRRAVPRCREFFSKEVDGQLLHG